MKYGETLRTRSVPQWVYQNVDYDSIKRLIKEHTTPGKGKAVSIPGQGGEVEVNFENSLYTLFVEQHDRIGLFVKSKSGEIDRRLEHLGRQLRNLELSSWPPSRGSGRVPNSRLVKYGQIEKQAIQAGEEIKLLSRFISAQRTAFAKLLKKYGKWTGRDSLALRFNSRVLDSPESFVHTDLSENLEHWTELLNGIRLAMGYRRTSVTASPAFLPTVPQQSSSDVSKRINDSMKSDSDVEFDTAFTYSPLGKNGARAVYWVHPEQLVELQVLLIQHTGSAFSRPSTSSGPPGSPTTARQGSISLSRRNSGIERPPDHGVIVIDDSERLAQMQNSAPISDAEEAYARPQIQPAATISWTSNSEAIMYIADNFAKSTEDGFKSETRMKKKHVGPFLDLQKPYNPQSSGSTTPVVSQPSSNSENTKSSRNWLRKHKLASPIVAFVSRRIRYASYPGSQEHGQWCTLDTDIFMNKTSKDDLMGKDWPQRLTQDSISFPYAVLEVRQEGQNETDLIQILDDSHLTERVRGFSLAIHSLWACRHPRTMTPPFWLPVLSSDIRKLPTEVQRRNRKASIKPSTQQRYSQETDELATSTTAVSFTGESSMASTLYESRSHINTKNVQYASTTTVPKRKKRTLGQKPTRYWSEYDHPEDVEEEGYYIYVDPEADILTFPFQKTFSGIFNGIKSLFTSRANKEPNKDSEFDPLLPQTTLPKLPYSEPSNDSDTESSSSDANSLTHHYDAIINQPWSRGDDHYRIAGLLISSMSLFFATTLSLVLLVLREVGRHKAREEIDLVSIVGISISLLFAIGGLWGLVLKERAGFTRWMVGILVFGLVLLVDIVLITNIVVDLKGGS